MKCRVLLVVLMGLVACSQAPSTAETEKVVDWPQVAVGQAWQEITNKSLYAPAVSSLNRKEIEKAFSDLMGVPLPTPLFSRPEDFYMAIEGRRFDELDRMVGEIKKPQEAARWHVYGAWINAVARSFDPHASFYPPSRQEAVNSMVSVSEEGLGLALSTQSDGAVKIDSTDPRGPGYKAGVSVGSSIVAISQSGGPWKDHLRSTVFQVHSELRGPPGTWVKIKTRQGSNEREFSIQRGHWSLDEMRVRTSSQGGYFILSIPRFYFDVDSQGRWNISTALDVSLALEKRKKKELLVVDLRGNPGGVLEQAVQVAGQLGGSGEMWSMISRENTQNSFVTPTSNPLPDVVWVDASTGSSAEILAGALQARGVPVVGSDTYGKTTLQLLSPLDRISFIKHGQSSTGSLLFTTARVVWDKQGASRVSVDCKTLPRLAQSSNKDYSNATGQCLAKGRNRDGK